MKRKTNALRTILAVIFTAVIVLSIAVLPAAAEESSVVALEASEPPQISEFFKDFDFKEIFSTVMLVLAGIEFLACAIGGLTKIGAGFRNGKEEERTNGIIIVAVGAVIALAMLAITGMVVAIV